MLDRRVLVALTALLLIVVALDLGLDYRLPKLAILGLYLALYFACLRLLPAPRPPDHDEVSKWPTSGPIGRYGQTGLVLVFGATGLFALLNPFQLVQIVLQAVGNLYLLARGRGDQPSTEVVYSLPFEDEWFVYNGGTTPATSHSWQLVTQRYAYDFVQVDDGLGRHTGRGVALDEYLCYGADILAAASGEVVEVVDGIRDAPWVGYGVADVFARSFVGNHVIVRHADSEYGLYAHLIRGSIPVAVGDRIERGALLGRCGHSGHSSEPHLHFHVQDRASFYFARGLSIRFGSIEVNGEPREEACLTRGDRVRNRGG